MPRVMRTIHEYYDNRVIRGLDLQVIPDGVSNKLRVTSGAAVVNKAVASLAVDADFPAASFVVDGNTKPRIDIVVLSATGVASVVKGTPGEFVAPAVPAASLLLGQISIAKGWNKFVGVGADDEVIAIRSQYVIDTRFQA